MSNLTVLFLPEDEIILAIIKGDFDAQILSQSTSMIVKEILQSKCFRILMDHREAMPNISISELYYRPSIASKLGVPSSAKIAIVHSCSPDKYAFVENVGVNSGFDIKVFQDIHNAKHWLKISPNRNSLHSSIQKIDK